MSKHTPGDVLGHRADDHLRAWKALCAKATATFVAEFSRFDGEERKANADRFIEEVKAKCWTVTNVRHSASNQREQWIKVEVIRPVEQRSAA